MWIVCWMTDYVEEWIVCASQAEAIRTAEDWSTTPGVSLVYVAEVKAKFESKGE